ncbi:MULTISPECIES: MarR family winged helix-turn-helix transcriptional regulator [Pseudoalteromonas]|uniref:MarR family transcriptional regulator n=1 Tax=Pseudoalteromonas amylolytica TaxID=1859457 RepID=A0A1S1N493_9GAMM|nr:MULTISPECIES: MarR family winged helix-turn-helix transcriptional regulator [Pseudoalteromonas]OHU85351.1 MarR family transcriptional regulator [Pseudoalteromonas sp. JW3]OHU93028.1 MarR family transcriptional regulator [Pseudoalteromonas amylolytica]
MSLKIDEFLPYRLVKLANKVSAAFSEVYFEQAGLTVPQWRVIAHLAQQKQCSAKRLCDLAEIDKSTMSRAVKQLTDKQLIELCADPNDKRAKLLSLTKGGEALYAQLSPKALEWEEGLLSELSDDEKQVLRHVMDKIEQQVDKQ